MRTRVKICGITRVEDALMAVNAGADAIGLVFYAKSPRFVTNEQAAEISKAVPPLVTRVALFLDADRQTVESVLKQVEIDLIQFHGREPVDFCEQFDRPYIKALGMKTAEHDMEYLTSSADKYHSAKALLLDANAPGEAGGTGETFDWAAIGKVSKPIILAGGLTPDNVRQAVDIVNPYAVDVSSGVERAPGIKDKAKVTAFVQQLA
jgi:phosphoribosylanthranilate isomerase